jgi:hypothetical protein
MHFDKAAYSLAKGRIVCLIKDSLPEWENSEGFIADGIICPDVYEKQPVRILCILAESYGYEKRGETNIEDQRKEDILGLRNRTVMTPRRLGTLLYLLQRSFENGAKVTPEEWKEVPDLLAPSDEKSIAILQDVLSKVAWVNVKKASNGNGTKLDAAECHAHACRNREILRQQIEAIAPNLIIVCGMATFCALHDLKLLGPETILGRKWEIQGTGDCPRVIEVTHPGYFKWAGYDYIYGRYEVIYNQMALREQAVTSA